MPIFSWQRGDPSTRKPYLPQDKQYLLAANLACRIRVSSMKDSQVASTDDKNAFELDGWSDGALKDVHDSSAAANVETKKVDDDEYGDLGDLAGDDVIADPSVANLPSSNSTSKAGQSLRLYSLSLSYDNYYKTPRVWLFGKDAATDQPLTASQMLEDVMQDYSAGETATIESHPHLTSSPPCISIHPCRHASAIMRILDGLLGEKAATGNAQDPDKRASLPPLALPDHSLLLFLKLVQSVVPHIEYDFIGAGGT